MLTLYSYPHLFGLEDNNPYGLKVFAFLTLSRLPFTHQHVLDTSAAPRGQLPYIDDNGEIIGDSDAIIAHINQRHGSRLNDASTPEQLSVDLLLRRTLDDLYWVMSYSRWRDDRFWPAFRDALLTTHPELTADMLENARRYNFERYRYQGIGRYEPEGVYARGLADLQAIAHVLGKGPFVFGAEPSSTDAGLYGFIASIYFYDIDTPLKRYVLTQANLVDHCRAMRKRMGH